MPSLYQRVRHKLLPHYLRLRAPSDERDDLVFVGSDYGGRHLPRELLGADSVCYCVGVGEETSFDEDLIRTFGCDVYAFDPTPRAIEHVARLRQERPELAGRFHFEPAAIWDRDGETDFFAPENEGHVSHSLTGLNGRGRSIKVRTRTLSSLMADRGHDRLDLLKLDVEGAEYAVVDHVLKDAEGGGVLPRVLCIEFDQPVPAKRTIGLMRRLAGVGYATVANNHLDFTFVRAGDG